MEKKASPLALSVWIPNTPGLSSKPSPHPHSKHSLKTNHCIHAVKQAIHGLDRGKSIPRSFLALSWPKRLHTIHSNQNVRETTASPRILERTTATTNQGKNNSPDLIIEVMGKITWSDQSVRKHTPIQSTKSIWKNMHTHRT